MLAGLSPQELREYSLTFLILVASLFLLSKVLSHYAGLIWRVVRWTWRVLQLLFFAQWLLSLVQRSPQAQQYAARALVAMGPATASIWRQFSTASASSPAAPAPVHHSERFTASATPRAWTVSDTSMPQAVPPAAPPGEARQRAPPQEPPTRHAPAVEQPAQPAEPLISQAMRHFGL
jgi:hypothetical protein